jgi:hypothetical protein
MQARHQISVDKKIKNKQDLFVFRFGFIVCKTEEVARR